MSNGVIYIIFGENAQKAAITSIESLWKFNPGMDVLTIGDFLGVPIQDIRYRYWTGENLFNPSMPRGFHFMAGRIKPSLYDLSPYDKTLYVDADTEFQASIAPAFDLLDHYDFMLAKHSSHNIGMLAEHPSQERLTTIAELGGDGDMPYPNSGVLFWKKCPASELLFQSWHEEWLRFPGWDEQLALMRAIYKHPIRHLLLPEAWNGENRREGKIIFHDFHGQQIARTNVT